MASKTRDDSRGNLTEMRGLLPVDLVERPAGQPFAPAPGLLRRRGGGGVQPLPLLNGAEAFLVTGFEESRVVFADPRFSADKVRHPDVTSEQSPQARAAADTPREDGMFIFMDPPEHTRLRRLLTGQFTVRRMKALEVRAREIAVEHIEAMRAAGTEADLVPAYALPIPSLMICELLGVDYADHDEFQHNTAVPLSTSATDEERADAARAQYRFLKKLVAHKREHPADDLMSGLVAADPPLTDRQLVDLAMLLLGAGHETTANMLALGTMALLANPDQLAALRADPSLIDATVEELMRFLTISQVGVTRVATADVTVGDTVIPGGATVILGLPEANRDPRLYPDPDRLDVTRPRTAHLGFGHGIHQCLGQQLARIEMRVGFTELFIRLPDLRLAIPAEQIPLRNDMIVFGVHSLPVAWS